MLCETRWFPWRKVHLKTVNLTNTFNNGSLVKSISLIAVMYHYSTNQYLVWTIHFQHFANKENEKLDLISPFPHTWNVFCSKYYMNIFKVEIILYHVCIAGVLLTYVPQLISGFCNLIMYILKDFPMADWGFQKYFTIYWVHNWWKLIFCLEIAGLHSSTDPTSGKSVSNPTNSVN